MRRLQKIKNNFVEKRKQVSQLVVQRTNSQLEKNSAMNYTRGGDMPDLDHFKLSSQEDNNRYHYQDKDVSEIVR